MKRALIALFCLAAWPAAAQTPAATPEITRATNALGAMWRPIEGAITGESISAACAGAEQEMQALDAAMPAELNDESAARVRGLRGLHIIPIAHTPGAAYFFPPLSMPWFNSGLGGFSVIDEANGLIGVRDASGQDLGFQLGRAGTHPMLRIRRPTGEIVTLAGCQPIAPLE
ncbi:MAG: hypothetical protein KF779_06225 [Hyphomonadaceae bacterium]|nr:hypothetical protein [Hyphomonadaceae bacterium]MCA8885871.1 hypothetical protein [Hyphomonadaceae bacterium]